MAATTGACLCGAVKYEFTGDIALKAFCNCKDCQRWGGAAGLPNVSNSGHRIVRVGPDHQVVVERKNFKLTSGTPRAFSIPGDSGKANVHYFCEKCGSSLYCELEVMPDKTAIKAGSLDNPDVGAMAAELYVKDRVSYMKPIEGAQQVPAFL